MRTISTSGGSVAYDSRGTGDPIVLLPGGGHDSRDYDEVRDLLPSRFRSIGVDWPGHGQSPAGTAPATELRLAQIVEELLDSLAPGGDPLHLGELPVRAAEVVDDEVPDLVRLDVQVPGLRHRGGHIGPLFS